MAHCNRAVVPSPQQTDDENCGICREPLASDLAVVVLPACKHRYHEICLQRWLSPIQLPNTTEATVTFWSGLVDPVFREIEERCLFFEDYPVYGSPSSPQESEARLSSGDEIDTDIEEAAAEAYERDEEDYEDEEMSGGPEVRTQESTTGSSADRGLVPRESPPASYNGDLGEDESQEEQQTHQRPRNLYDYAIALYEDDDQDEEMSDGPEVRTQEPTTGSPADEELVSPQSPPESSNGDLEEGEVQEEEQRIRLPFSNLYQQVKASGMIMPLLDPYDRSQDLPPIFKDYIYDMSRFTPRETGYDCGICRGPAFVNGLTACHADTLQLIRLRLRLTDLAYRCLDFHLTEQEQIERAEIVKFLNRRHADNIALGEREVPLTRSSCRRVFRQARSMLRKDAYVYALGHRLENGSIEDTRVMRFATFFEKYRLREEEMPFFFDANPAFNDFIWSDDFQLMPHQERLLQCWLESNDPRFFKTLRLGDTITPHSYVRLPSASDDESPKMEGDFSDGSLSEA
ncbi:MAG: hypothetical protein Q9168_000581 [Polycauliona sp. 1 TL-2023]